MRALTLCIAAIAVVGCASAPFSGRPEGTRGGSRLGWKQVVEKRDPVYLIAVDFSECTVSRERYEKVAVGDRVFCLWQRRSLLTRRE